jgi:hypothetical protein
MIIASINKVDAIHQPVRNLKTPSRNIKKFVRGTLGCQCPDDVFEKIEYGIVNDIFPNATPIQKIIIGNRLLILIWKAEDPTRIQDLLPSMIRIGKEERDRLGLNRCRIVIATGDVKRLKSHAERIFRAVEPRDEKLHLHIVCTATLRDL